MAQYGRRSLPARTLSLTCESSTNYKRKTKSDKEDERDTINRQRKFIRVQSDLRSRLRRAFFEPFSVHDAGGDLPDHDAGAGHRPDSDRDADRRLQHHWDYPAGILRPHSPARKAGRDPGGGKFFAGGLGVEEGISTMPLLASTTSSAFSPFLYGP